MTDLISRADAIEAIGDAIDANSPQWAILRTKIGFLPSAEAKPTVIRSRTLMPTKDFKEWAKRVRETNPNVIVIPCDAEVVSADAVHGEWIIRENGNRECSLCGHERQDGWDYFCGYCGARMKGGDDE